MRRGVNRNRSIRSIDASLAKQSFEIRFRFGFAAMSHQRDEVERLGGDPTAQTRSEFFGARFSSILR
jgi:hypothetical protein